MHESIELATDLMDKKAFLALKNGLGSFKCALLYLKTAFLSYFYALKVTLSHLIRAQTATVFIAISAKI